MSESETAHQQAGGVHLVLLSHSRALAEGAAELAQQVAGPGTTVHPVGGTADGRLGTDAAGLSAAVENADGGGVLLIPDLGSSVLTARAFLADYDGATPVGMADAPFVEGAVAAAVAASVGGDLSAVRAAAEEGWSARKS